MCTRCAVGLVLALLVVGCSGSSKPTGGGGSGDGDAGVGNNAAGTTCPGGRYLILDPGDKLGTGLVKDTTTNLTWDRSSYSLGGSGSSLSDDAFYCQSVRNARLPTKDEAVAIAGANFDVCAWPVGWLTWTSTSSGSTPGGEGMAWYVPDGDINMGSNGGSPVEYSVEYNGEALCVR